MAKSAKMTRRKVTKATRKTRRKLAGRLESAGLRKKVAHRIAGTANVRGELSGSARTALDDMVSKVDTLASRIGRTAHDHSSADALVTRGEVKAAAKQARKADQKARRMAVRAASDKTKRAQKKAHRAAERADEMAAASKRMKAAMKAAA